MAFDHKKLEAKWQKKWEQAGCFKAEVSFKKPKFYALNMFPYPSGAGLHIGHLASYTPTEVVARYKRCRGFNVLHPMGYDSFGLPAEQYAIRTGIHPSVITLQAINHFRFQLKSFGYSFDWDREISTCEPPFYRWTQFLFLQFLKKGLAYRKKTMVNWCPALRTILANEEVVDGKSERGGHPVIKKPVEQWLLKITQYADRLLKGLQTLNWPERTREGQRHWIGKSFGLRIRFPVQNSNLGIEVFTTRADTLFGVSFIVLSPEHPLVGQIVTDQQKQKVDPYLRQSRTISDVERKTAKNKTGVFTGAFVSHPFTGQKLPVWVSDYVLMDYGTGAVMAVPAHDEKDHEFAQKFKLPVLRVIKGGPLPFTGDGVHVDSGFLNGLNNKSAIQKVCERVEATGCGKKEVQYKLKDWIFSRQRYWGEPFPVVHFKDGRVKPLSEDELPVTLPETAHYRPSERGEPPLARQPDFVKYKDPGTGEEGLRDTNTMPGYAASSWYFLRYTDPHNKKAPFDFEKQRYWMPVDLYIGGPEHTVGHLLYARFWQKFLYDMKMVSSEEPFKKLMHQGMILGEDGQKMSKSRGNVASPDDLREQYGADAVRLHIIFLGPLEKNKIWSSKGVAGSRRFLDRVWRLCFDDRGGVLSEQGEVTKPVEALLNHTIQKVTEDIESLNLNTAVSSMMILVNELYRKQIRSHRVLKTLVQLLMPFAPHLAEEIWEGLGGEGFVSLQPWPKFKEEVVLIKPLQIGVQVNGRTRGSIACTRDTSEGEALQKARALPGVQKALKTSQGQQGIKKVIYKPGRILNLIIPQ